MLFTTVTCYIVIVLIAATRGKMGIPSSHGVPICQECGTGSNGGELSSVPRQELDEQYDNQLLMERDKKRNQRRKKGKNRKVSYIEELAKVDDPHVKKEKNKTPVVSNPYTKGNIRMTRRGKFLSSRNRLKCMTPRQ